MESPEDKHWASKYLLDPLTAPEPSQETGPGTHHNVISSSNGQSRPRSPRSHGATPTSGTFNKPVSSSSHNSVAFAKDPNKHMSTTSTLVKVQDPSRRSRNANENNAGSSSSTRRSVSSRHRGSDQTYNEGASSQRSSSEIPTSSTGRRRSTSLYSRFDGDQSHRPLDMIRRDVKLANRAPHLRKKHHVGADSIDNLDAIGGGYHHEGPYDATLLAKNISAKSSPLEAVRDSNLEALKATPREMVRDSIRMHRPLDGVAMIPPGMKDSFGRTYNYVEGTDMMIEDGGNYKRWPGVDYLPEDLKGKGEPSYSIEKALKEHKNRRHRRVVSDGHVPVEMTTPRSLSPDSGARPIVDEQRYTEWESSLRGNSSSRGEGIGLLKKRFGSLRRR